jgi:3-deoxy-D-manno-octulosonic-acid transferase
MVFQLYNLLLFLALLILTPILYVKGKRCGEQRDEMRQRIGLYDSTFIERMEGKSVVWVHAASVGETKVALILAKEIRQKYPEKTILITNMTLNGLRVSRASEDVCCAILFPIDFSFIIRKLLKIVQPELILVVETEIWPNFIRIADELNIPQVMVNGRVSKRSYPRYRAIRPLLKPLLQYFKYFCMQSQESAERIVAMGAPNEKVRNTGNLKFDYVACEISAQDVKDRKHQYRISGDTSIIVAGSTHAGEEELLVVVFEALTRQVDNGLILVIIPRYPERKQEISNLLKKSGVICHLRSSLTPESNLIKGGEVLLVDTLGEVLDFYSVADLVFVGGSLVDVGGHNVLEAAMMSKPVLFGPHIQNFNEISSKLVRSGAGIRVANADDLCLQMMQLLKNPGRCRAMGEAGRALIVDNAGAMKRTMDQISRYL